MRMEDVVKAAKQFDFENRPKGKIWVSVPDSQVARLLQGALLAMKKHQKSQRRPAPVTEE